MQYSAYDPWRRTPVKELWRPCSPRGSGRKKYSATSRRNSRTTTGKIRYPRSSGYGLESYGGRGKSKNKYGRKASNSAAKMRRLSRHQSCVQSRISTGSIAIRRYSDTAKSPENQHGHKPGESGSATSCGRLSRTTEYLRFLSGRWACQWRIYGSALNTCAGSMVISRCRMAPWTCRMPSR